MTTTDEIQEIAKKILMQRALQTHGLILQKFEALPTVLKQCISSFHKARRPHLTCPDCNEKFYILEDGCGGPICMPCIRFTDDDHG